jgi:cyclopropane-fatty-acyl-phospholipid synthase
MPFARTEALRRELAQALPERSFTVRFWDGTELPPTNGHAGNGSIGAANSERGPIFTMRSPKAVAHVVRAPGELGLGRAYVAGDLEVDDLDRVIELVDTFAEPRIDAATRVRLALAAVRACGLTIPPRAPKAELHPKGRRHSKERDAKVVRHHYDVSNDFFKLFLDDSMTYSCAIFSRGAKTLEEAQHAKLDLVCKKLALKEGERVLDVGCGWGAFAIHAARDYGVNVVGITLSPPQAELARRRIAEAGLSDRVEIRVADYRDLHGERYDAVASIGMVEHVGESKIDVYATILARLLTAEGRLLNHGIARLRDGVPEEAGAFTQRYVFPDGVPLQLSRVQLALERAGFVTEHVEGFAQDYHDTLTHWIDRLDANREQAERLVGSERLRVWRLYLRGARNIFKTQFVSIYQTLAKPRRG